MSTYLRPRRPGARVFFTVTLATRGGRLLVEEIDRLRAAVARTRAERWFGIEAWVLLPDHMHCIWVMPEGDADYSTRWGAIKARFTRSLREEAVSTPRRPGFSPALSAEPATPIPTEYPVVHSGRYAGLKPGLRVAKREQAVWQRRFWEHHIRDEADFAAHLRYCWMNPVKHGFVDRPEDWPYSSVHRDARFVPGMDLTLRLLLFFDACIAGRERLNSSTMGRNDFSGVNNVSRVHGRMGYREDRRILRRRRKHTFSI